MVCALLLEVGRTFCTFARMIREISPADIAPITYIYNEYVAHSTATFETESVSEAEMAARLANCRVLVAEAEGVTIGYAYLHRWKAFAAYSSTAEVTVYLHPGFTGQGIGRRLLMKLLDMERKAGRYHSVIACITAENERSVELFAQLGFRQVSRFESVGLKFGRWLDVVDLQLTF